MAHDIFISYSSKNKSTADAICSELEQNQLRCWIAPRDILPGTEYGEAILNAIENCRIFVLVFSAEANDSPQVKREVERAVSKGKIIIPFRIENIVPTKALEYALSSTHWLDAMNPPLKKHVRKLCNDIKILINEDPEDQNSIAESTKIIQKKKSKGLKSIVFWTLGLIIVAGVSFSIYKFLHKDIPSVSAAENATIKLTEGDFISVEETANAYAAECRKNPFVLIQKKEALTAFAERLKENVQFAQKLPRSVAIIYRLKAASILLSQSNDFILQSRQSLPWIQNSLELYSGFTDNKALIESRDFFNKIILGQVPSVDAIRFIKYCMHVAMIEATEEEIANITQQLVEALKQTIINKNQE